MMLFIVLIVLCGSSLLFGYLVHTFIPQNVYLIVNGYVGRVTTFLLSGSIVQISVIAMISTASKSIFSIVVFGIALYVLVKIIQRKVFWHVEKPNIKILQLFALITLLFLVHQYFFLDLNDYAFYASLSNALIDNGMESTRVLLKNFLGIESSFNFYHFGELWLTGFYANLFNINSFDTYCYITIPFFHLISILTILSILENLEITKWKGLFFCIPILYGATFLVFPLLSPEQGHYTFWYYSLPDVTSLKSLISLSPIFLIGNAIYNAKFIHAAVFSFLLTLFNILFLPVLFFTLIFVVCAGRELLIKSIQRNRWFKVSILVICVALSLASLFLLPVLKQHMIFQRYIYPFSFYWNMRSDFVNCFLDYFSRSWLLFPFTLFSLIFCFRSKRKINSLVLFHLLLVFGLSFTIMLFKDIPNITQILSLYLQGGGVIVTLFVLIESRGLKGGQYYLLICFLFSVFNVINSVTPKQRVIEAQENANYSWIKKLENQNLAFVSGHTWSSFWYNSEILELSIFRNDRVHLPFDITPCLDSDEEFENYLLNNPDYPIKSKSQMVNFLQKSEVKYLFVSRSCVFPFENFHLKLDKCGELGSFIVFRVQNLI